MLEFLQEGPQPILSIARGSGLETTTGAQLDSDSASSYRRTVPTVDV